MQWVGAVTYSVVMVAPTKQFVHQNTCYVGTTCSIARNVHIQNARREHIEVICFPANHD